MSHTKFYIRYLLERVSPLSLRHNLFVISINVIFFHLGPDLDQVAGIVGLGE